MNVDLTTEQIEKELAELIERSEGKVDQQESEMVVCDGDDDRQESEMVVCDGKAKDDVKKDPKIKKQFVHLSKEKFEKLSKREQLLYKIELSKNKTDELKSEYRDYKSKEIKANLSRENRKLIIMGRFLEAQFKNRKDRYEMVDGHLREYLQNDSDRSLFGFPLLSKFEGDDNS